MVSTLLVAALAASALSVSAAPYGQKSDSSYDSYGSSSCEHSARSYGDCSKYFSHDKQSICDRRFGSAGTEHGDCITAAAAFHDKCVSAIDRHQSFCWSFDFSSSGGDYNSGYDSSSSYSSYKSANWSPSKWGKDDGYNNGWNNNGYKNNDGYKNKGWNNNDGYKNNGWNKDGGYKNKGYNNNGGGYMSNGWNKDHGYKNDGGYKSGGSDDGWKKNYYAAAKSSSYGDDSYSGGDDSYNSGGYNKPSKDSGYSGESSYSPSKDSGYGGDSSYQPSKDSGYKPSKDSGYGGDSSYKPSKDSGYKPSKDSGYGGDSSYKPSKDSGYKPSKDSGYGSGSSSYGGDSYSSSCGEAKAHFDATGSPTLQQCVSIACAQGQSKSYISRALYQCDALEKAARQNNGGNLPQGW
ncbi:hypothetical protein HKX48_009577 [Thoreauomyces humboldtii]|nr:hypothetical protein HKX48_009577 [Thoreauomyces humboldtii]